MQPKYKHDCTNCKYLGTGKIGAVSNKEYDFYICETGSSLRTVLARFGNDGCEYISNVLLLCEDFSELDLVFLFNGLELTEEENKRLFRILKSKFISKCGMKDYISWSISPTLSLGEGNFLWRDK